MTAVDDLDVGMWVTISDCHCTSKHCRFVSDGVPWQIHALSLPMLLVAGPMGSTTVDLRAFGVQMLNDQYVNMFCWMRDDRPVKKPPRKKLPVDECPRCHEKMPQQLIGPGTWAYACRACGYKGSLVPNRT